MTKRGQPGACDRHLLAQATDPFHDIKIYHKSLYYIMKGEMYDNMDDWYEDVSFANKAEY